jgi:hypothetical protein
MCIRIAVCNVTRKSRVDLYFGAKNSWTEVICSESFGKEAITEMGCNVVKLAEVAQNSTIRLEFVSDVNFVSSGYINESAELTK